MISGLPKIGLEAVLEMAGFNRGMSQYTKGIAKVEKETAGATKGMSSMDKTFSGLAKGFAAGGIAIAGATSAMYGLKQAFEFGKEGAALTQTTASFNRFLASVGKGPEYLDVMAAATNNTVDNMTLMLSTMTLVAGTSDTLGRAMIDNSEQLLRIAKAANKLNPSLGDTAFLYDSLARGVKRSSPLILDNLGLTIKVGEANEAYAKSIGKTVEQLTAEEKQLALLYGTIEAGDRLIAQAGGIEAYGDEFAQIETDITNLTNEIKMDAYPIFRDFLTLITSGIDKFKELHDQLRELGGAGGVSSLFFGSTGLINALDFLRGRSDKLVESTDELADSETDLTGVTGELSDAQAEASLSTEDLEEAQKALDKAIKEIRKSYEGFFGSLSKGIIEYRELGEAQKKSAEDYQKSLADLRKEAGKSLRDVRENFEASLPDPTTVEDRMGMAGDAWDEWGLRIQDIIQNGVESPWYAALQQMGYSKPPDVGLTGWLEGLKDKFYAGQLPDLLPEDWAAKVRAQQQEATAAVREENAKRLAEAKKARDAELAAEKEARDQAKLELALSIAEQTNLLQAWSQQRFGPSLAPSFDEAQEVLDALEVGLFGIDEDLQSIIGDMLAGIDAALDTTGAKAEENTQKTQEILDQDWLGQREGNLAMLGQVISDTLGDSEPMDTMLYNFETANQGILNSAAQMAIQLGETNTKIEGDWNALLLAQLNSWNENTGDMEKRYKDTIVKAINETPREVTITVTTDWGEGGTTYYGDEEGKQSGGPVTSGRTYVVGEAGPELFIPRQQGLIIPNWAMNLPASTSAGGGGGGISLGPSVQIQQAVTINNGMDLAEFQARTLQTVQRAIQGG